MDEAPEGGDPDPPARWVWPSARQLGPFLAGVQLLFIVQAPAPALLGYALGYPLVRPDAPDRTDALLMIPLLLLVTVVAQALGLRAARGARDRVRGTSIALGQALGLLMAPILFLMTLFVLYD